MFNFNNRCCNTPVMNCGPIMEPPIENCVQKDIIHEVEQDCQFMIDKYITG